VVQFEDDYLRCLVLAAERKMGSVPGIAQDIYEHSSDWVVLFPSSIVLRQSAVGFAAVSGAGHIAVAAVVSLVRVAVGIVDHTAVPVVVAVLRARCVVFDFVA
jgi:hypothetical protein